MTGWLSNGMQLIAPITVNGTVTQAGYINFNGVLDGMGNAPALTQLPFDALVPFDIQSGNGQQPTTAAASAFQVAAHAAGLIANQGTMAGTTTAGTVTLSTVQGMVPTGALTTAPGATYQVTLTNTLIAPGAPTTQVALLNGTNTAGQVQVNSVTDAAGSTVAVFQNVGTSAFNGTLLFAFHV